MTVHSFCFSLACLHFAMAEWSFVSSSIGFCQKTGAKTLQLTMEV